MTFFTELQLYYMRKIREVLRNPSYLFMTVAAPVLYLVLFAPLLKGLTGVPGIGQSDHILNMFMPGMLILLALYGGLFVGFGLIDEIRQGVVERFRVTPTSRLAILLGGVMRDVTSVLVQSVLLTLVAIPFGLKIHWGGYLLILIIAAIITALFSTFSYALALKLKSEDALAPITQGIATPLTLLAGVMLPMELAPKWLLTAAHFNPLYYAVEASRALINGDFSQPVVWQAFLVLIPLLALAFGWAVRSYRTVVG